MKIEGMRCAVGGRESITHDDGVAREPGSSNFNILPRTRRCSQRKQRERLSFAPERNEKKEA